MSSILKEKFKILKEILKWCNENVFGWVDLKIEEGVDILNDLESDMIADRGLDLPDIQSKRKYVVESIWSNLKLKEIILKQKSRQRWIREGDRNSKYFHTMLKARNRHNAIVSIRSSNWTVEGVS